MNDPMDKSGKHKRARDDGIEADIVDSTEFKLALLASLCGCEDTAVLMDALLECSGDVDRAKDALCGQNSKHKPFSPRQYSSSAPGYQASLSMFNIGAGPSSPKKRMTQKGKTVHLYSPDLIAANTPCSIIHNFLPRTQAEALLRELLHESQTYGRDTFKLFDNVVSSPHTFCFYVDEWDEAERQKNDYIYNGSRLGDVRRTTPEMRAVGKLVERAVNEEIQKRIRTHYPGQKKLKHQSPHPWVPNTSFVNCYDGAKESVGYHSDQLTYLGPRAVIGSLSLGVAREFRIRKIVARKKDLDLRDEAASRANEERAHIEGQISIHLPHNSLLVMHAEMQEEWKHSIAPAQNIEPHPIAKNKRLNVTYRCYRDSLHPSKTPKCKCGVPTVLRCVQKQEKSRGNYMWMW